MERRQIIATVISPLLTIGAGVIWPSYPAAGAGLVVLAVIIFGGLFMTTKKPAPPDMRKEPIPPAIPSERSEPFRMEGCVAIGCGTAIVVGEGVELESKNFVSFNTPQLLEAGRGSKVKLDNTFHHAPDPSPKKTDGS